MTSSNYAPDALIHAARAAAEAFLAALDSAPDTTPSANPASRPGINGPVAYDPLHDAPPFTPDPSPGAPEAKRQMAWITYLGAVGRINAEKDRGANSREISALARKAGYPGGNAVNGWNSRPGNPRAIENRDGARWLNDETLDWIRDLAKTLGIELAGDYVTVPKPKP